MTLGVYWTRESAAYVGQNLLIGLHRISDCLSISFGRLISCICRLAIWCATNVISIRFKRWPTQTDTLCEWRSDGMSRGRNRNITRNPEFWEHFRCQLSTASCNSGIIFDRPPNSVPTQTCTHKINFYCIIGCPQWVRFTIDVNCAALCGQMSRMHHIGLNAFWTKRDWRLGGESKEQIMTKTFEN